MKKYFGLNIFCHNVYLQTLLYTIRIMKIYLQIFFSTHLYYKVRLHLVLELWKNIHINYFKTEIEQTRCNELKTFCSFEIYDKTYFYLNVICT